MGRPRRCPWTTPPPTLPSRAHAAGWQSRWIGYLWTHSTDSRGVSRARTPLKCCGKERESASEKNGRRMRWRCSKAPGTLYFEAGHVLHLPGHSPRTPDEVWRRYGVPCPPLPCEREGRPSIIAQNVRTLIFPSPHLIGFSAVQSPFWINHGARRRTRASRRVRYCFPDQCMLNPDLDSWNPEDEK